MFSLVVVAVYQMGREITILGRVIGIAFLWFYLTMGARSMIGLALNGIFHLGIGADLTVAAGKLPANAGLAVDWVQFLLDLIPAIVVSAMAAQNILQMLLFGNLFGAAMSAIGDAATPWSRF